MVNRNRVNIPLPPPERGLDHIVCLEPSADALGSIIPPREAGLVRRRSRHHGAQPARHGSKAQAAVLSNSHKSTGYQILSAKPTAKC